MNAPLKKNRDLDILSRWIQGQYPFIFETNHELTVLRSFNIADEFQLNAWIKGSGYEYRRVSEIATINPFIILPLNFPVTPDISNPYQALSYDTSELKHWDLAPDNPAVLINHDIDIAFTTDGLSGKEFRKNLSRSVGRGLSESHALAALTTVPAERMGKSDQLGKIKKGFLANLTIVDGNYFNHKSRIVSTWVGGEEYPVIPKYEISVDGEWRINIGNQLYQLELQKKTKHYSGKLIQDTTEYKLSKLKVGGRFISWQVKLDSTLAPSRFTGHILENRMEGTAHDLQVSWEALKTGVIEKEEEKGETEHRSKLSIFFPEGTYGLEDPQRESQTVRYQK